jgi:hypothetical protein
MINKRIRRKLKLFLSIYTLDLLLNHMLLVSFELIALDSLFLDCFLLKLYFFLFQSFFRLKHYKLASRKRVVT